MKIVKVLNDILNIAPNKRMEYIDKLEVENLDDFILYGDKTYWGICAEIIYTVGVKQNNFDIDKLLVWLQDLNWPGAFRIIDLLKNLDKEVLVPHIERALLEAKADEDYMWIGGILELVDAKGLSSEDFSDRSIFELLKLSDF